MAKASTFTFINNNSVEGDRLSVENRQVVRKHCRNRWRLQREQARKAEPEIRMVQFGDRSRPAAATAKAATIRATTSYVEPLSQGSSRVNSPVPLNGRTAPMTASVTFPVTSHESPWSEGVFSSCNPFDSLPVPQNHWANVSIQYYLTQSRPTVVLDNAQWRQDLFIQRRDVWLPMAISDEAAFCAFLAWVQTDIRCPSHLRNSDFANQCHEKALRLAKDRLSLASDGTLGDSTAYAIGMLNFTSWNIGDHVAMTAHYHGYINVLAYRNGLVIDPVGYAKSSKQITQARQTKGYELGFKELSKLGMLESDLSSAFRYYIARQDLTALIERDSMASAFMMNHVDPVPCDLYWQSEIPATRSDGRLLTDACHATIHIAGFLMFDHPYHTEGNELLLSLEDTTAYAHRSIFAPGWQTRVDGLLQRYPLVLMWVSLVAGTATRHTQRKHDFSWVLKSSIEATNIWNFGDAVEQLSTYFTWPGALTNRCQPFWMESVTFDTYTDRPLVESIETTDSVGATGATTGDELVATATEATSPAASTSSSSSGDSAASLFSRRSIESQHSVDKLPDMPRNPDATMWITDMQRKMQHRAHGCLFMSMKRTLGPYSPTYT